MFVSLRKYLYGPSTPHPESTPEPCLALLNLSRRLLQAIDTNLLLEPNAGLHQLKSRIRKTGEDLAENSRPCEIRSAGEEIGKDLSAYRVKLEEVRRAQSSELNHMLASLHQTIAVLSGGNQRTVQRLQKIGQDLERAAAIEDIVALKSRLADCLQYVRDETAREKNEAARNLALMRETLAKARESIDFFRSGVPGRADAEQALRNPPGDIFSSFAAVFVLDRYHAIASRFGAETAEAALEAFMQDLRDKIAGPKRMFRWNDRSLVLLLERPCPKPELAADIRKVNWAALEKNVEVGNRVAVLSLSNHWAVFSLNELPDREALIAQIDQFAGAPGEAEQL